MDIRGYGADRQIIQRLVDELESREWVFVDSIPEHHECLSCDGGGPKQGNQPKHTDDCTYAEVIKDAKAYLVPETLKEMAERSGPPHRNYD